MRKVHQWKWACTMNGTLWAALLALACMSPAGLSAQSRSAYAVDNQANLYQVDVANATTKLVGNTGIFLLEGLAISPGGQMFGTDDGGNLYRINTKTAASTLIGSTGLGDLEGLDFFHNILLAVTFTAGPAEIVALDTNTAKPTVIVTADTAVGSIRAMAVAVSTTHSVIVCADDDPTGATTFHSLYAIDLKTGSVTFIGTLDIGSDVELPAMDFNIAGQLFGLDVDGNVWRIDPTDAAATLIGNTGGNVWLDMKFLSAP